MSAFKLQKGRLIRFSPSGSPMQRLTSWSTLSLAKSTIHSLCQQRHHLQSLFPRLPRLTPPKEGPIATPHQGVLVERNTSERLYLQRQVGACSTWVQASNYNSSRKDLVLALKIGSTKRRKHQLSRMHKEHNKDSPLIKPSLKRRVQLSKRWLTHRRMQAQPQIFCSLKVRGSVQGQRLEKGKVLPALLHSINKSNRRSEEHRNLSKAQNLAQRLAFRETNTPSCRKEARARLLSKWQIKLISDRLDKFLSHSRYSLSEL